MNWGASGSDPNVLHMLSRVEPPSARRWLGTDGIALDVLLRLLMGGRVSLFVALTAALGAAIIGTAIGLIAGYWGGRASSHRVRS